MYQDGSDDRHYTCICSQCGRNIHIVTKIIPGFSDFMLARCVCGAELIEVRCDDGDPVITEE
jgi:hypothetical protein